MLWSKVKLPKLKLPGFKLPRIARLRPGRATVRKMVLGGLAAAALVGTYYWGRQGGLADARPPVPDSIADMKHVLQTTQSAAPNRDVVAYIYGSVPITRQELGDYLIDRFGNERIEFLINRKIIDMACQAQKIIISDAEIKAQLEEDLKGFNCSEREFVNNILKKYNKTLFEWKEDVIRPKLALQRYVRNKIDISEEDIQHGFEAKYGDKVECRLIVLSKEQAKDKYDIWNKVSRNADEFDKYAKIQYLQPLAAEGGKIPPIHKHFGDKNIEIEAFKLQPGEVTPLLDLPEGTVGILQCVRRIPADTTKRLDEERMALHGELLEMRLAAEVKNVFADLRKQANPQVFLRRDPPPSDALPATARQPHLQTPSMPGVNAAQQTPGMPGAASVDKPLPQGPPSGN